MGRAERARDEERDFAAFLGTSPGSPESRRAGI
jgi:hypothetical protein